MKKILTIIFVIFALFAAKDTYASEKLAVQSARLTNAVVSNEASDMRILALRNIFKKYNSPLVDQAKFYVRYADEYKVDWRLLPSISGLESSFGIYLMPGSYNAYGWGGGYIYFESWEEGIKTINRALRQNYMNRGAQDVWSIGPIYAESPTWAERVSRFMEEINREYLKLSIFSVLPNI